MSIIHRLSQPPSSRDEGLGAHLFLGAFTGLFLVAGGLALAVLALPIMIVLLLTGRLTWPDNWLHIPLAFLVCFVLYGFVGATAGAVVWCVRPLPRLLRLALAGAVVGGLFFGTFTVAEMMTQRYLGFSMLGRGPVTWQAVLVMAVLGTLLGIPGGIFWERDAAA